MRAHFLGKSQVSALAALVISSFGHFPPAAALEFAPVGASGDAGFRDVCPTGHYLTGASARTGAWVDQIAILCSPPVNPDGSIGYGPPPPGPKRGGEGGSPLTKTCASNEIVHGMGLLHTEANRQVRLIAFYCGLTTGTATHNIEIGNAPFFPTVYQICPAGEAATGIQGRFGLHVNALGLICGPLPSAGAPPPDATTGGCTGLAGEELAICNEHNAVRAKHGVPALNWSADLASNAKNWVAGCHTMTNSNGDEFFCHQSSQYGCGTDPGYNYGENLSFGYPSRGGQEAARQWYCEVNVYNFDDPSPLLAGEDGGGTIFGDACNPANNPKKVTGHFTQVIWRNTTRLGCAQNRCKLGGDDGIEGTLWACEYDPPGNFNAGQAGVLEQNVPRPLQGFAGHSAGAAESNDSPQRTTAIISDVDLYDIPGGVGNVIGILRKGQRFPLIGCREDDWCQLSPGWVWGSFVARSHSH
ncbi:CAP domain-containing protein [Taklimakanibacter deserti]|uniref:CAP domain-containing protein n=1 Tax=Taklimakanibacter deserti TaxID=2267839 RepID=UPI0013C476E4